MSQLDGKEKKVLLNLQDEEGHTALHYAYARRDKEMIALLERNGASAAILNHSGKTPKDMAKMQYDQVYSLLNKHFSAFILDKSVFKNT